MGADPRYRSVRPLYPEIADTICDCELLPKDYVCQREDLVHTREVACEKLEVQVDGGRRQVSYTREHRCCPMCDQAWWWYGQSRTDLTYARDDETRVVGSVSWQAGAAVRCGGRADWAMLDAWLPCYLDALAVRDRQNELSRGRPVNALRAAIEACVALAERNEATRMLAETTARARKLASGVLSDLHPKMTAAIGALETNPDDAGSWKVLADGQRRCAEARLDDPAREQNDWTIEEWWTPALVGVARLQFEIHALRHAARGTQLGSPEHQALRACEDAIAAKWCRHLERVAWPHPEAAFVALLAHAESLQPLVVAGDMASWTHPDRIGRALRALLESGAVIPTRHVQVASWLAARTGLPDARQRFEARAAASYWLPIRRARRAAAAHEGSART